MQSLLAILMLAESTDAGVRAGRAAVLLMAIGLGTAVGLGTWLAMWLRRRAERNRRRAETARRRSGVDAWAEAARRAHTPDARELEHGER
ncbi:MAG: hypothetical protein SFY95_11145 [Planctomycetota bacterium]|nr:hypothetical protein [Planctomycetota bacterium]